MKENLSLSVSQHFAGQLVRVDTPAGSVVGVLRDANRHLMLESPRGWAIIAKWFAIKTRQLDPQPRFCRDCEESTVHQTGSQLWVSCSLQDGWRPINSKCVLAEKKGGQ